MVRRIPYRDSKAREYNAVPNVGGSLTKNTHSKTVENKCDVGYRIHAPRHTITLATEYYCIRKKITAPAPRNPRPGLACTNTLHDPKSPAVHIVRHDQSDRCIRLLAVEAGGGRRGATHAQMVSHRSAIGGLWLVTRPLGGDFPASTDEPVIRVCNLQVIMLGI